MAVAAAQVGALGASALVGRRYGRTGAHAGAVAATVARLR